MSNKYYFWYKKEILERLNELGFVHEVTKEPVDPVFYKEGIGFMIDTKEKTYTKCFVTGNTVIKPFEEFLNDNK
jgi:hypothetical protein